VAIVIDITGRKAAEDRQRLLLRELQHRTRNVFAVVQSVAAMTLSRDKAIDVARADLASRLQALANAYAIGGEAPGGASLDGIIGHGLKGFSSRIQASGCDVRLNPTAAQHFALVVHELATNAVKHGALSTAQGQVRIEGAVEPDNDLFIFRWQESGGPPVQTPDRKGFGTRLLLDSMQGANRGVTLQYPPEGLRYELRLPLGDITSPEKDDPPHG
jgi:two-component sensor histidine kinase